MGEGLLQGWVRLERSLLDSAWTSPIIPSSDWAAAGWICVSVRAGEDRERRCDDASDCRLLRRALRGRIVSLAGGRAKGGV